MPEITFHDWERTVDVLPDKNHVLRGTIGNFNSKLYDIISICRESQTFYPGHKEEFGNEYKSSFTDRKGSPIQTTVKINSNQKNMILTTTVDFMYNNEKNSITLVCKPGEKRTK